ncbi:MAG: esterase, partial [Halioglobus sp.]|nr:esterase [Halioglobus sp.]
MADINNDPRIDPRIKAIMGALPVMGAAEDASSREDMLAEVNTPEALAMRAQMEGMFDLIDNEDVAPSTGLTISTHEFTSQPDGNTIKLQFIRPDSAAPLPCVYYIHGGGMQAMSAFQGMYRAWGKIIA